MIFFVCWDLPGKKAGCRCRGACLTAPQLEVVPKTSTANLARGLQQAWNWLNRFELDISPMEAGH